MPKARQSRQVFISWSGKRSLAVAESLCDFIPRVIPELKDRLFVSTGIEKGARWSDEIARHLEEADAGILCLTAEGLTSPWLHFEAGALTKGLDSRDRRGDPGGASSSSRIFTYLHGITPTAFSGPLSEYQWTAANRDDTWRLMNALHDLFATARSDLRSARRRFDERWPELERDLRRNAVLVTDIVPEFEGWFQRKTFVESLDECTDRNWIARYDGARDTHTLLIHRADQVRIGCTPYQWQLYQQLIAVTDAYVMGLRPLIRALPDDESTSTPPTAVPSDISAACELQRARANTIVQLILHPVALPFADDAVPFSVTDSAEQRRALAQQYEDAVREIADRRLTLEHRGTPHGDAPSTDHPTTGSLGLDSLLATADGTRKLFRSLWALDRIVGYVAWEHLYADTPGAGALLLQRAASELETIASQAIDPNPLPLQYALQALAATLRSCDTGRSDDATPTRALCSRIEEAIDASRTSDGEPTIDRGKQLRVALTAVRRALDALPADTPSLSPAQTPTLVPDPLEDA